MEADPMNEQEWQSFLERIKNLSDEQTHELARIIDQALKRYRLRHGQPVQERPEHRACRRQS